MVCPEYKLIKDFVNHILSGCDVHDGLRRYYEFFHQVLMLLGAIAHREASLHGMELVPCLDLHHGQCDRRTMTDSMKGNLLDMGRDVVEASVDEGTMSIDGVHTVFTSSWRDSNCTIRAGDRRKQKNYQDKDSGNQNRRVHGTHLTHHHGVGLG